MLLQLNIMNFALIEKLSIDFSNGFNVLSGETGAGKSILIDAINFVLGGKFNKNLIRVGEDKTVVEAVFSIENPKTLEVLEELEINDEGVVILTRESFSSGKTIAKVNNKTLLLSKVKQVSETLIDIHGQHENQNLLDSTKHINYVDSFGQDIIMDKLSEYETYYNKYLEIERKIFSLQGNEGEREKKIDFLRFQIDEINTIKPKKGEDEELSKKFNLLSNGEKIKKALEKSYILLKENDESRVSIIDSLTYVVRELKSIEKHFEEIKPVIASLEEAYYNLEDNISTISDLKEDTDYDIGELEFINSRMYQLSSCKKKYGPTLDDVINYRDSIEQQYYELVNCGEIIEKLQKEKDSLKENLMKISDEIHEIRSEISSNLEKEIKKELDYVGLEKSVFKINVELIEELTAKGRDKVQFTISTNPGQPLQPLEEVVSGGELSRIMLALKTVFVDKDHIPSVIFDEVDTGISGRIAQRVGEKMVLISENHQVFCITHLPQIAALADANYLIEKSSTEVTTFTKVKKLNLEEVKQEVARIIGGSEVTVKTLENAGEMIEKANEIKSALRK
ncbi:DNA repair protein RecN [Clostridium culturomicium]|uniref:DNA repair protein RecN n=1 Tax=Clostridium culturomicium TaxID=1499683 RepID=UPI00058D91D0|nr:DNA repair protein RecN [Clostridium culturomicium]